MKSDIDVQAQKASNSFVPAATRCRHRCYETLDKFIFEYVSSSWDSHTSTTLQRLVAV